jgi:hypothetical protein
MAKNKKWLDKHSNEILAIAAIGALFFSSLTVFFTISPPEKKANISAFYTIIKYSSTVPVREDWLKIYFFNGGNAPCINAKFWFIAKPEPKMYYTVVNDNIPIEEWNYDKNSGQISYPATRLIPTIIACPEKGTCVYQIGYVLPNSLNVIAIPLEEIPTASLSVGYNCANTTTGELNISIR